MNTNVNNSHSRSAANQSEQQKQLLQPKQRQQQVQHSKALIRKQNAISVTLTPDLAELDETAADGSFFVSNEINSRISPIKLPIMDVTCGDRRNYIANSINASTTTTIVASSPVASLVTGSGGGGGGGGIGLTTKSLNIPSAPLLRKLSLQPFNQFNHQSQVTNENGISNIINRKKLQQQQQQQQQILINVNGNNNNYTNFNHNFNGAATTGSIPVSLNNLNVVNQSNPFIHRKSVIGRLERSSFQTQRLSDVGVAFGQQITAKMGLKLPASQERIVEQTKWLYQRYVLVKLRQNALPLRDLNLSKSTKSRRPTPTQAPKGLAQLITNSEPASAIAAMSSINPLQQQQQQRQSAQSMEQQYNSNINSRKRATLTSQNLNSQDLSLLAARLDAINLKNESDLLINSRNSGANGNSSNKDAPMASTQTNITSTTSNKKYLMDPSINNQVFTVIVNIIRELRDLKPEFYGDSIYELIGMDKFSSLQNLLDVQRTICQEMIRSEISWCRICALFSLFGAMSLDCVRLGVPEHVGPILDGFIKFVENDLALWISQQGGWESFLYKYRASTRLNSLTSVAIIIILSAMLIWLLLFIFK